MANFEDSVKEAVEVGGLPGAVMFARDKNGRLNWAQAVGRRSLEPGAEKPMQLDSIFKLASTSKLLTTIAVLQVVERGLVGLDDDVAQYVPGLANQEILIGFTESDTPVTTKRKNIITLRRLLTHTAGTGYDFATEFNLLWKYRLSKGQEVGKGDYIEERMGHPLLHEPGHGFTYGCGVTWAGKVLEKVTGMTLGDWIAKHMCEPLGLTSITFNPFQNPHTASKVASISWRNGWTGELCHVPGLNLPESEKDCLGGEGLYASLEDYMSILFSVLMDDEKLLKKETAAIMFQPQLNDEQHKAMVDYLDRPCWICSNILREAEYDWGFGGVLITGDKYDYLKKGSLMWSGLLHLIWWIDREAGICGAFATQLLPGVDKTAVPIMCAFQKEAYERLEAAELRVQRGLDEKQEEPSEEQCDLSEKQEGSAYKQEELNEKHEVYAESAPESFIYL